MHQVTGGRFEEARLCSESVLSKQGSFCDWVSEHTLSLWSADEHEGEPALGQQQQSCILITRIQEGVVVIMVWTVFMPVSVQSCLWNGLVFVSIHQSCRMSLILLFCGLVPVQQERASPGWSCHSSSLMSGLGLLFFNNKLKSSAKRVP